MQLPRLDFTALTSPLPKVKGGLQVSPALVLIVAILAIIIISSAVPSGLKSLLNVLVVIGGGFVIYDNYLRRRRQLDAKKAAFASANSIERRHDIKDPDYPGMFFKAGRKRILTEVFTVQTDAKPIEIGNYRYTTGYGKNQRNRTIGYMRIKLPRRLPNMLLDARANNFLGTNIHSFPTGLDAGQRLQLEGDFNNYFTLYAPKQYERDALYVFTPDVMAALIDNAREFDVEVIDDDMYVYNTMQFNLADDRIWKKLLAVASSLSPELDAQTDYYADERVGDRQLNQIAQPGKRLKSGFSWITVLIVITFFAFNAFTSFANEHAQRQLAGIIGIVGFVVFWGGVYYFYKHRRNQPINRS